MERLLKYYRRFGWYESAVFLLLYLLNRIVGLERLEIVWVDREGLRDENMVLPDNYTTGFMDYKTLRQHALANPALEMSESFLQESQKKHDLCYVISDADGIASHGWYSRHPTRIEDEKYFCFDRQFVYMHKGLTQESHRGRQLHGIGMAQALRSRELSSARAMVSFVDRRNAASLRSVYRLGYRRLGSVYMFTVFGRFFSFSTPGCRKASVTVTLGDFSGQHAIVS